ncbi:MAG: TIGR02996 domain-containing protein [Archangium sp.]
MIERTLEKSGKSLALTAEDRITAQTLVDQSKTKLKQGWAPVSKPADAVKVGRAFLELGLDPSEFVGAFSDAEVDALYAQLIRDEHDRLSEHTLRARPTRALLEYLMSREYNLLGSDLSKAIKFISKKDDVAKWVEEVMHAALAGSPSPRLKKFATQQLKNFAKRAEAHEAPQVAEGNETSLLENIAANPTDDQLRLVYADFLMERGIGWGEVIPLSLKAPSWEYGTPEYESETPKLEKLTKKHLKQWLEPIRPFISGWSVERGLLSSIDTQPGKFIEAADAIALRAPRALLMLGGLKAKDLPRLATTPLGKFSEVRLSQQRLNDEDMALLAASPTIAGVETWDLGGNHFGDEGVRAIANSPHFKAMHTLDLNTIDEPVITSAGLRALMSSGQLPALTHLNVTVTDVNGAFDDVKLKLTSITMQVGRNIDDDALDELAKVKTLEQLSVQQNSRARGTANVSEAALLRLANALPKLAWMTGPSGALPESVEAVLKARR